MGDGLLVNGGREGIPPALYKQTLADLHNSNKGIEKMQFTAKATVYWPGIDANIVNYIN